MHKGFEYSDILRVEVNRLAVRTGPTLDSALMQGERIVGVAAAEPIGDVRLDTGDFVSVQLGPLPIGDVVWYLVWPAEDARLMYSTVSWNTTPGGDGSGPGWVAGAVGQEPYLALYRRPEVSEVEQYLPVGLNVSGTGDYVSEPQARHDMFSFDWAAAAAADSDATPCAFSVNLHPIDGVAPIVAAKTSTSGVAQGPRSGPGSIPDTPWGPSAGGSWDSFTVRITSDCTWTIRLTPLHHD